MLLMNDAHKLYNVGNMLDEQGRFDEAADAFRRSIEVSEVETQPSVELGDIWLCLGQALRSAGKVREAQAAWEQALRCNPSPGILRANAVLLCTGDVKFGQDGKEIATAAAALRDLGAFDATLLQRFGFDAESTGSDLHDQRHEDVCAVSGSITASQDMFVRLFCIGCGVRAGDVQAALPEAFDTLMACGLLAVVLDDLCIGAVQIFPFRGLLIMTDWPSQTLGPPEDPVMAIGTDSMELCLCLADGSSQGSGGFCLVDGASVLDLCTGSGIAALHAARCGAGRVVAADVSPRACLFTRANAALNGLAVDVRRGDLYDALEGDGPQAFDLVLANPPFVAAPVSPARVPTLYADGGPDGLAVTARILSGAGRRLVRGGLCVIVGEFPNVGVAAGGVEGKSLCSCLPPVPGMPELILIHAEAHVQTAEEYAVDRAAAPHVAEIWRASLHEHGVVCVSSGVLVGRFVPQDGAMAEGGDGAAALVADYRRVTWDAQDADESWTAARQRGLGLKVVRLELMTARAKARSWAGA